MKWSHELHCFVAASQINSVRAACLKWFSLWLQHEFSVVSKQNIGSWTEYPVNGLWTGFGASSTWAWVWSVTIQTTVALDRLVRQLKFGQRHIVGDELMACWDVGCTVCVPGAAWQAHQSAVPLIYCSASTFVCIMHVEYATTLKNFHFTQTKPKPVLLQVVCLVLGMGFGSIVQHLHRTATNHVTHALCLTCWMVKMRKQMVWVAVVDVWEQVDDWVVAKCRKWTASTVVVVHVAKWHNRPLTGHSHLDLRSPGKCNLPKILPIKSAAEMLLLLCFVVLCHNSQD